MGGLFGGGGGGGDYEPPVQDNSAYERQLAEQREATRISEEKAAKAKLESEDALKRQQAGRLNSLLTGASGDDDEKAVKRRGILGSNQKGA